MSPYLVEEEGAAFYSSTASAIKRLIRFTRDPLWHSCTTSTLHCYLLMMTHRLKAQNLLQSDAFGRTSFTQEPDELKHPQQTFLKARWQCWPRTESLWLENKLRFARLFCGFLQSRFSRSRQHSKERSEAALSFSSLLHHKNATGNSGKGYHQQLRGGYHDGAQENTQHLIGIKPAGWYLFQHIYLPNKKSQSIFFTNTKIIPLSISRRKVHYSSAALSKDYFHNVTNKSGWDQK